ncbi:hypothetical protein [Streptomyces misionensis]|uniref:hypothetical protein n=1 Tax=Streptomyces TaxID=1883 RepID=UPI0033B054C7
MVTFSGNMVGGQAKGGCARLCGASLGEAEPVLLGQVFGPCVSLGLRLRAECATKGR